MLPVIFLIVRLLRRNILRFLENLRHVSHVGRHHQEGVAAFLPHLRHIRQSLQDPVPVAVVKDLDFLLRAVIVPALIQQ